MGSCQHPVSREQGPPTEVRSIVAKTDLPWPPAQAGVLASHNAVYRQLPAATVCGRQAVRGSRGSVRTHPTLGRGKGCDPALMGPREHRLILRESERTQPHPWGTEGDMVLPRGPKKESSEFQGLTLANDSQEAAPGTVTVRDTAMETERNKKRGYFRQMEGQ